MSLFSWDGRRAGDSRKSSMPTPDHRGGTDVTPKFNDGRHTTGIPRDDRKAGAPRHSSSSSRMIDIASLKPINIDLTPKKQDRAQGSDEEDWGSDARRGGVEVETINLLSLSATNLRRMKKQLVQPALSAAPGKNYIADVWADSTAAALRELEVVATTASSSQRHPLPYYHRHRTPTSGEEHRNYDYEVDGGINDDDGGGWGDIVSDDEAPTPDHVDPNEQIGLFDGDGEGHLFFDGGSVASNQDEIVLQEREAALVAEEEARRERIAAAVAQTKRRGAPRGENDIIQNENGNLLPLLSTHQQQKDEMVDGVVRINASNGGYSNKTKVVAKKRVNSRKAQSPILILDEDEDEKSGLVARQPAAAAAATEGEEGEESKHHDDEGSEMTVYLNTLTLKGLHDVVRHLNLAATNNSKADAPTKGRGAEFVAGRSLYTLRKAELIATMVVKVPRVSYLRSRLGSILANKLLGPVAPRKLKLMPTPSTRLPSGSASESAVRTRRGGDPAAKCDKKKPSPKKKPPVTAKKQNRPPVRATSTKKTKPAVPTASSATKAKTSAAASRTASKLPSPKKQRKPPLPSVPIRKIVQKKKKQ